MPRFAGIQLCKGKKLNRRTLALAIHVNRRKWIAVCAVAGATLSATGASAGFFSPIVEPGCGATFSWGEQYSEPNFIPGQTRRGTNGLLTDQWFMLTRWQGQNEDDYRSHAVTSYDIGNYTGLFGATQYGVTPEVDGSSGVQSSCAYSGMFLNTWTTPHRPIVGGGYNDMFGYKFSLSTRPFTHDGSPTGSPSDLIVQSNIVVPHFWKFKSTSTPTGENTDIVAHVGIFAYLRDLSHFGYPPIAVSGFAYMSDLTSNYLAFGMNAWDYTASATDAARASYPYWFQNSAPSLDGVCFVSAPISTLNNHRWVTYDAGIGQGDLTMPLPTRWQGLGTPDEFWRMRVTPENITNIANDIDSGGMFGRCPMQPPGGYSRNPSDWVLEYAGVIAELTPQVEKGPNPIAPDVSRTSWLGQNPGATPYNDSSKDQSSLGVRTYATGIIRYVH